MKINKKKILIALSCVLLVWFLSCSRSCLRHKGQVPYSQLPKAVQDTLNFMNTHSYLMFSDEMINGKFRYPDEWNLVDFTHSYTLVVTPQRFFHWIMDVDLKNTKTGRKYRLDRFPEPIIIYGSDMYVPTEHNMIGKFTPETMFDHYILN